MLMSANVLCHSWNSLCWKFRLIASLFLYLYVASVDMTWGMQYNNYCHEYTISSNVSIAMAGSALIPKFSANEDVAERVYSTNSNVTEKNANVIGQRRAITKQSCDNADTVYSTNNTLYQPEECIYTPTSLPFGEYQQMSPYHTVPPWHPPWPSNNPINSATDTRFGTNFYGGQPSPYISVPVPSPPPQYPRQTRVSKKLFKVAIAFVTSYLLRFSLPRLEINWAKVKGQASAISSNQDAFFWRVLYQGPLNDFTTISSFCASERSRDSILAWTLWTSVWIEQEWKYGDRKVICCNSVFEDMRVLFLSFKFCKWRSLQTVLLSSLEHRQRCWQRRAINWTV